MGGEIEIINFPDSFRSYFVNHKIKDEGLLDLLFHKNRFLELR